MAACSGGGRTEELTIEFRQLTVCTSNDAPSTCEVDAQGIAAVSTHGLHICQAESGVGRIHVTVESVPPDASMPHEYLWTCDQLGEDWPPPAND